MQLNTAVIIYRWWAEKEEFVYNGFENTYVKKQSYEVYKEPMKTGRVR